MKNITMAKNLAEQRIKSDLTLDQVADAIGKTAITVSRYERGERVPDGTALFELSNLYGCSMDSLFEDNKVKITKIEYRDEKSCSDELNQKKIEYAEMKISQYEDLEFLTKQYVEFKNPIENDNVKTKDDVYTVVEKLRKKWSLAKRPLGSVVDLIESKGIRVIMFKYKDNFNGFCGWANDKPIIFINKQYEVTRTRFTLLHELAHILTKFDDEIKNDKKLIESLCDEFASQMLILNDVIYSLFGRKKLSNLQGFEIKKVKELFGISFEAILIRLAKLKLISWPQKNLIYESVGEGGFGNYTLHDEIPKRFSDLVETASKRNLLTPSKLEEYLDEDYKKDLLDNLLAM
ncbi:helix-turn-helix domain-containing protein [Flammeovirga sp. EKP202]|uniref:helix-turn-helix domain-containing protein n=1 Tax=Flammeovirga sp. EKP202 TaxID=2770592 RepID=UPI00165EE44A|nr:helix-turn-helix domain-containing protein [Flammeovirga sp. EKP202]MBD0403233.1 helix-turn-helix domain-containing protein [Flammeovirga sp. EKP202]